MTTDDSGSAYRPAMYPPDEPERIEELRLLRLLETESEARFDRFTALAADLFDVPVALFNLVDTDRVWYKSAYGDVPPETGRDVAFCSHAILEPELLVVPDATQDARFRNNPLVTGGQHIRFYAGAVVRGPRSKAVGTLCLIDHSPRKFPEQKRRRLLTLARLLEEEIRHESEVQSARQSAFENVHYDQVTGLPNARLFKDRLTQALEVSRRAQARLMIALVKIPDLLDLRAVLGTTIGDDLLRACAKRLTYAFSSLCTVARWREDTFAVLLPTLHRSAATTALLEVLYTRLAKPMLCAERTLHLRPACGGATYPESGVGADELIRHANIALREATQAPRRCWKLYSRAMSEHMLRRIELEHRLRDAVKNDALSVAYQPIVDFASMEIHRVEALARWTDPDLGQVDPETFVSLAEASDLILDVDRLVIRKAVKDVLDWERKGLRPLMLSVNLASRTLLRTDLADWLTELVTASGLEPTRVILEVTENSLVTDLKSARRNIRRLRKLGFGVAIDDFGTGFSSFNYLKTLAVDELKLDRAFLKEMTARRRDASIANTIIQLARELGIPVVAEGVETRDQLVYLQAYNCDEGQGHYFDPPLDSAGLARRLAGAGRRTSAKRSSGQGSNVAPRS